MRQIRILKTATSEAYLDIGGHLSTFTVQRSDNVPWNKHRWQINKSTATLYVEDWPAGVEGKNPEAWTSIRLQEVTQAKSGGPIQERNVSISLDAETRKALLEYLSDSMGYELKLKDRQSEQKAS